MAAHRPLPKLIYADHGYTGEPLKEWIESRGSVLEIVGRAKGIDSEDRKLKTVEGFVLLPKRSRRAHSHFLGSRLTVYAA
jgi:hypothetical protein